MGMEEPAVPALENPSWAHRAPLAGLKDPQGHISNGRKNKKEQFWQFGCFHSPEVNPTPCSLQCPSMNLEFDTIYSVARLFFFSSRAAIPVWESHCEGFTGSDCRVTHWGDGFLLHFFFPLGQAFFPKDSPCFPGVPPLISQ